MRMSSPTGCANTKLPDIDERLVAPGSDYEIDDERARCFCALYPRGYSHAVTSREQEPCAR